MKKLTVETLENYLKETYKDFDEDQGFFMKLVEEIGEVAELLNIRTGRKGGDTEIKERLAKELADVIHSPRVCFLLLSKVHIQLIFG